MWAMGEHPEYPSREPIANSRSFSTVRPVKKVDTAGSELLSTEYMGTSSVRKIAHVPAAPESPPKSRVPLTARGRAGQALVEEVLLGVLDSVGPFTRVALLDG